MIVKTRMATTTSPEPNDADPIEIPAAIHDQILPIDLSQSEAQAEAFDSGHVIDGVHPLRGFVLASASAPLLDSERKKQYTQRQLDPRHCR